MRIEPLWHENASKSDAYEVVGMQAPPNFLHDSHFSTTSIRMEARKATNSPMRSDPSDSARRYGSSTATEVLRAGRGRMNAVSDTRTAAGLAEASFTDVVTTFVSNDEKM